MTLSPGDLVVWDEEREDREPAVMLVSPDGQELLFQFGTKPWSHLEASPGAEGLTASEAERVLRSPSALALRDFGLHGHLFKSFDAQTGQSYPDPRLEIQ